MAISWKWPKMLKSGPQVSLRGCPTLRKFLSLEWKLQFRCTLLGKPITHKPCRTSFRPYWQSGRPHIHLQLCCLWFALSRSGQGDNQRKVSLLVGYCNWNRSFWTPSSPIGLRPWTPHGRAVAPIRRPRSHRSGREVLKDATKPTLAPHSIPFLLPFSVLAKADDWAATVAARSATIVHARHTALHLLDHLLASIEP
jgi:hypothetical protein